MEQFRPTSAVFNLTNQCNLRCTYCFVHHNNTTTTLETGRAVCEYLLKNAADQEEKPTLWFFGGEPMLQYNQIIVPLVEEYFPRINFGITTNGTFLTEDVIDFFFAHQVEILLSIDGIAEVQDAQRPTRDGKGSFNTILHNIPYLLMHYPDVTFRATLTKLSIPHMMQTYGFAQHMGFKHISWIINEDEEYDEADQRLLTDIYNQLALRMIKGSPLMVDDFDRMVKFLDAPIESIHRCGYGTTSIGVAPNGDILPCQELSSYSEDLVIGNVFTGIDPNKHQKFLDMACQCTPIQEEGLSPLERKVLQNSLCPKHQYTDCQFQLSTGRKVQILSALPAALRLRRLCAHSTNDYYRGLIR